MDDFDWTSGGCLNYQWLYNSAESILFRELASLLCLSLPLFFKLLLIYLFLKMRGMGGLEGAKSVERMLCFNVGGFLQACNVKNPSCIVNNGEESPARRYKRYDFFRRKN
jgi:hypothetical protein